VVCALDEEDVELRYRVFLDNLTRSARCADKSFTTVCVARDTACLTMPLEE
jgi:hypothetical protein